MVTGAQTHGLTSSAFTRAGVTRTVRNRAVSQSSRVRAPPPSGTANATVPGTSQGRSTSCQTSGTARWSCGRAHDTVFPLRGHRNVVTNASATQGGGGALVSSNVPKMKVAELKTELETRGLPTHGLKAELVERLVSHLRDQPGGAGDGVNAGDDDANDDAASENNDVVKPAPASEDSTYLTEPPLSEEDTRETSAKPSKQNYQRTMFNSRPAEQVSLGGEIDDDSVSNFSGMELTFLGTSSGSPSFTRNVSSYALRLTDEIWLFDCGEATQHQLMRSNLRYSKITRIFITHMHGDHIFGLPGLICALSGSSAEKRRVHNKDPDPLYITGPPGICEFVKASIICSRTVLGLPLVVTELTAPGNGVPGFGSNDGKNDQAAVQKQMHFAADGRCKMFLGERWPDNGAATAPTFKDRESWSKAWSGELELPFWTVHREKRGNVGGTRGGAAGGLVVRAAPLRHPVPCFGYVVDEPDQAGRIEVEKCVALGLPPGKEYSRLKAGFDVTAPDGTVIKPEQVLGCDRPGRRLCLLGDTCDSIGIARLAKGADVLIHESTFARYKHDEAVYKGHSTSQMAGEFARMIKARNLLLTHFSNRYGTANTRQGGTDGSENNSSDTNNGYRNKQQHDDEVEDDMALPEDAPIDMRQAEHEEFTLVEGLVREAAEAKGDKRVVAASDFFAFNVQRRESFDKTDDAKGNRDALFDGPLIAPLLETYEDARRRMDSGVKGYYSPNYGNDRGNGVGRSSGSGGFRGRGRGGGDDGSRGRGRGRGYAYNNARQDQRGFTRGEDGSFQRRVGGESGETIERDSRGERQLVERPVRSQQHRVARPIAPSFDADSASIDSSRFVEDFQRRNK